MNQIQQILETNPEALTQRLGCIVTHERDPRNKAFMLADRIPKKLPKTRYKYYNDPVFLDQGNTPSCVGHAWSHWRLDGPTKPAKGEIINPFEIYDLARDNDEFEGNDYEGSSTLGGAKAARQKGWLKEFYWGKTMEDLFWWLLNDKGPAVVGSWWHWDMFSPDKKGMVTPTGGKVGGHEWEYNGINMDLKLLRAKQSWGKSWGKDGHFWTTFETAENLIFNEGDVCFATENKIPII